ncbi:inorganic pyrophosphatase [Sporodiniella umbellata]|nr:inorganic pyrophosphatase [Sporodiniella umbellata]
MFVTKFVSFGLFCSALTDAVFTTRQIGSPYSLNYTVYFENDGNLISPFHDIPLFANKEKTLYNMVVEIPRWTNAKNEINKETKFNPIKQDTTDGKPRFVTNIFPFKGYIWNYGALPQTWEDPGYIVPYTHKKSDNDPIDVVEIGQSVATVGQVKQVKILGIIALVVGDVTDWKLVAIDNNDPLAKNISDIQDVDKYMPGYMDSTIKFYKEYKRPDGKPYNYIGFHAKPQNKKLATEIILGTHVHWQLLMNGTTPRGEIQTINTSVRQSIYRVNPTSKEAQSVPKAHPEPPSAIDGSNDVWYFIS